MKQTCRNCHFLSKEHRTKDGSNVFSWSIEDRSNGKVKDLYAPCCSYEVWDAAIDPSLNEMLTKIIDQKRKDFCFFIEFKPGMSYQAAKILQDRISQNKQLKKSNLFTQIGLWIAAFALLANVLVTLFK